MLLTVASRARISLFARASLSLKAAESARIASLLDSCHSRSCRMNTASIAARSDVSSWAGSFSVSRIHTCRSLSVWGVSMLEGASLGCIGVTPGKLDHSDIGAPPPLQMPFHHVELVEDSPWLMADR